MAEPRLADRPTDVLPLRPLPVGAFALPFGYLLLPPGHDEIRELLLTGRLPATWPDDLRGHALALAGDVAGAAVAFDGDDPVSRFNRFVLDPDTVDAEVLRTELGSLGPLVDVVAYGLGRSDAPPAGDGADGEILALVLAAQAAALIETAGFADAASVLARAVEAAAPYPPLAGVLYLAAGQVCRSGGDLPAAIAALQEGEKVLRRTDLVLGLAELHVELGTAFHELADNRRDLLSQAVNHYHAALALVERAEHPELFASAHANLAAAYLTMPMIEASDQLRLGVAVGSLRAALEVYTPETHPAQWASAQLNLANALVYAPSTHQADNLSEAVELYEAVLVARDRHRDPLGYARVLANQGNALAHLGMFEHARGKLVEARYLFEELGELDATHSVRGLLDEIARTSAGGPQ